MSVSSVSLEERAELYLSHGVLDMDVGVVDLKVLNSSTLSQPKSLRGVICEVGGTLVERLLKTFGQFLVETN